MSNLSLKFEDALRQLDPKSAATVEQLLRDLLEAVRQKLQKKVTNGPVDANGWPIGHFEKYAGILAGDDWEPSPDPPPESTPEW